MTLTLSNGGDGPGFTLRSHHHQFVGEESIETPAGEFAARRYQFLVEGRPPID